MIEIIEDIDKALVSEAWYSALALAISLPDICAFIETGENGSKSRFIKWFESNLPSYSKFLSGADCYALRCAYLHQGHEDTRSQNAQDLIERYYFVAPKKGWTVHFNRLGSVLQLQVDVFSKDISAAAIKWWDKLEQSEDVKNRLNHTIRIRDMSKEGILITSPSNLNDM